MNTQTTLRDGLRALAHHSPPAAVPEDFFDLAHARLRQRRAVIASAVAVAVLVLGAGLLLRPGTEPSAPSTPGAPGVDAGSGLPRRLYTPPIWTASATQSAPGVAAVIFGGPATQNSWDEGRFAVVAASGDRYRTFNEFSYTPPGFDALLSPDGSLIARNDSVRSLRPGGPSPVALPGEPVAFSPDGTLVAYQTFDGIQITGTQDLVYNSVAVFDLRSRRTIAAFDNRPTGSDRLARRSAVAIAADNTRIAIQLGDRLRLYRLDRAEPTPYATATLREEILAGPGSWLPGGRSLATARLVGAHTWRLVVRNGDTAELGAESRLPSVDQAQYVRIVGWRADGTAVAVAGVPAENAAPVQFFIDGRYGPYPEYHGEVKGARLVSISPGSARPQTLLDTPVGVHNLDVAADLAIAGQFRDLDDPEYGLATTAKIVIVVAVAVLALLVAVALWRLRRSARRARRQPPAPGAPHPADSPPGS